MSAVLTPEREAFLARRRGGLGGSDIAPILGMSPFKTAVDVWLSKTGRAQEDDLAETRRDIRFGLFGEQFVADEYERATGRRVHRYNGILRREGTPLLGNVDRLVIPDGAKVASHQGKIRTDRGLECKTANAFAAYNADEWGPSGSDMVPEAYLLQAASYMALSGCSTWDLAVLFGNGARPDDFRIYTLRRDRELEEMLVRKATEWWQRHVVADVAPEPVCDEDVKRLYPRSTARPIEATMDIRAAWDTLRIHRASKADAEAGIERMSVLIKDYMGECDTLSEAGVVLATWKSPKDSVAIDWEAIARSAPIAPEVLDRLIADHSTPKPGSRRFLVKTPA